MPEETAPYEGLRRILAGWEPATGGSGFEGLVAQALAAFTGYTFRLSRSGSQFGRDAATPSAPFAIAMEAKRYDRSVPLQELVGKAGLAGFALSDRVDLWVLAATVEIGENTASSLIDLLDNHGLTGLILDWAEAGLPRLATLLAAAGTDILPWVESVKGTPERELLGRELDCVRGDPRFQEASAQLKVALSPGTVGLDAFRRSSRQWAETRLSNRKVSQLAFSQFVVPLESPKGSVRRNHVERQLDSKFADPPSERIVAVLGPEGTGKTWAVTRWGAGLESQPILLLSIGRAADLLSPEDAPLDTLAKLAAVQEGRRDEAGVARWRRRLENWSGWTGEKIRLIVLIDGLNETSGKAWASILSSLVPAVASLGGMLIVTCRAGYWEREVEQRLSLVSIDRIDVGGYDDRELRAALDQVSLDPDDLAPELREFMRNPRVCALAIQILPQLAGARHLTIERLLLEFWRARLLERGDLIGHDARDFNNLLISHARAYRERPGVSFDRDDWRSHSAAARRADGRTLSNDLTDIEEGRFFDAEDGKYSFRPEALRFALGLLIIDEVRETVEAGNSGTRETVQRIIEAIRGFDIVAEILISAIGIACLDEKFPNGGIAALIGTLATLQNVPDDLWSALQPYAASRPVPFLEAFEDRDDDRDDRRFTALLLEARSAPAFAVEFGKRVDRWLGSWSREGGYWRAGAVDHADRAAERNARIDDRLAEMTPFERELFDRHCPERRGHAGLARAATLFLAGRPQAPHAEGVIAYALVLAVAADVRMPTDELNWAIRLNVIDHPDLAARVRQTVEPLCKSPSRIGANAAGLSLRLLGTQQDADEAERLAPVRHMEGWRLVESYCAVDPLDPSQAEPDNIANAVAVTEELNIDQLWNSMSLTTGDHQFEMVIPGLARFRPDKLVTFVRRLTVSVREREGLPLRQLALHLPWLSPLHDEVCVAAVSDAVQRLVENPDRAPSGDRDFILLMLTESLLPHLTAEQQLELLISLPDEMPYYWSFQVHAKQLASEAVQRFFGETATSGNPAHRTRALHFAAANPLDLTPIARRQVLSALEDDDENVAAAAADVAVVFKDTALDARILEMDLPGSADRSWRAVSLRRAFATAVARRNRLDLIGSVAPEHLGWVTRQMPEAAGELANAIDACLDRLSRPIAASPPKTACLELEVERDELSPIIDFTEREQTDVNPIEAFRKRSSETAEEFTRRRQHIWEEVEAFLDALAQEDALHLVRVPALSGLDHVIEREPERIAGWLQRLLAVENREHARRLQNLAMTLAQAFAAQDPGMAASVFRHFWEVEPYVSLLIGPAKLKLRDLAIFGANDSPEIDQLRWEALMAAKSDAELESLVLAAAQKGKSDWLDAASRRASRSALPREQALALTIASQRPTNPCSDAFFAPDRGTGFLAAVAEAGLKHYRRDRWAHHWYSEAAKAESTIDFWRFQELGRASSDRRTSLWLTPDAQACARKFGGDLQRRLGVRIQKVSRRAEQTLFGVQKPSSPLAYLIAQSHGPAVAPQGQRT